MSAAQGHTAGLDAGGGLSARMQAAKNRFKAAIERAPEVQIRSSDKSAGASSSLVRAAAAFVVAAAAANPVMSVAAQESLDSVKPVAFLKVNGSMKHVLPQASIFDVANEVAKQLGSEVKPTEVFSYLVYAHGMDWQSMVACHGMTDSASASQLVAPLVADFQAAQDWSMKQVKTGAYFRVEARLNYMLSSTKTCRAWKPGVASFGDAQKALRAYAQETVFKSDEAREMARSHVNDSGFFSVSPAVAAALAPAAKEMDMNSYEIFMREKDGKPTFLFLEYDDLDRMPEARMWKIKGIDEPIGFITTGAHVMVKGDGPRASKVLADVFISHEQAHLDFHANLMMKGVLSDLTNLELQANLVSAKKLMMTTDYSLDEILDAHSRVGVIESDSSVSLLDDEMSRPKLNSYAKSRRQTMEILSSLRGLSRDNAVQELTRAIDSSQFALDQVLAVHELGEDVESAGFEQESQLSAVLEPSPGHQ